MNYLRSLELSLNFFSENVINILLNKKLYQTNLIRILLNKYLTIFNINILF